jgi:LacI family transcriptional regulator
LSIAGAHDSAWSHGSALLVVNTARERAKVKAGTDDLLDRRVDSILFTEVGTRRTTVPDNLWAVPTILINSFGPGGSLPDDAAGGYAAARLLLDAGHREIAHLAGRPVACRPSGDRQHGHGVRDRGG